MQLWFIIQYIILLQVFVDARYTAIDLLLPQPCKPLDLQCVVKIHIENSNVNSTKVTTYKINQSLTYIVSNHSID